MQHENDLDNLLVDPREIRETRPQRENEYMNYAFTEMDLLMTQRVFNEICDRYYSDILSFGPEELARKSNARITIPKWKNFLLNPLVKKWYDEEREVRLRSEANKMSLNISSENSPAKQQAFTTIMNMLNKRDEKQETNEQIIIYMHVPLTKEEEENPNIKKVKYEDIPTQISNAYYDPRAKNDE